MKNVMALVDCDSFFCSCEKIFRPDLKKKPVIVLSNNDGCVISRNREAKSLGIQMGVPYFKVKSFCQKHKVAIFSSNFSLYTEVSKRIINILKTFSSNVEVYSIDEAFIDLTGVSNPHQFSLEIKKTVEQFTKVPVSIGVAPTKGLTKAACFIAKKDLSFNGVVSLLTQEDQKEALKQMPINKLWGVSKGREARLIFMGIKTALDFRDFENQALIKKTLTKVGLQIQDELRGVSCFPIGETQQKKKEVMSSRSFGKPVYDLKTLREIAANHAHEVAEELRKQKSVCKKVHIFVRSNPFREDQKFYKGNHSLSFLTPTSNTFKITELALKALDRIYIPGIEYKKLGVQVSDIQDEYCHALSLFEEPETPKEKALMTLMDFVNKKEGARTLKSFACGINDFAWYINQNYKSPRYTTSWNEIPEC